MIGLGSNRMSVCRRGGMSVTQAGRGGMEWLEGNGWRMESPYSAQAAAALKAQFPTQWPTIRDYGFAHPALVPFINEDPMLVMSLIDGLGTRWLVGDGTAWLSLTNIIFNVDTYIDWRYKLQSKIVQGSGWRAHGIGNSHANCYVGIGNNKFAYAYGNIRDNTGSVSATPYWGEIIDYDLDFMRRTFTVRYNGEQIDRVTFTPVQPQGTNNAFGLYCWRRNNSGSAGFIFASSISKAEFGHGDTIEHTLVPFNDGGTPCMLDMETGDKYYNANSSGSFTISETPAS